MSLPDWARAHGLPLFAATIRTTIAEFNVSENLGVEFSGDGEHDVLRIEKSGANTEWVSRQLASFAGVAAKEVGYSGLKDRHAVTRQWFSVPRWHTPDWDALDVEGVTLLEVQRHSRKIRRGTHKTNRFKIVLRGALPDAVQLNERLQLLANDGVPNYFGEQRFGRGGGNIRLADQWSAGARLPRHQRGLAMSSARSFLFNDMLAVRVAEKSWTKIIAGDIANLDGSGSVFTVERVDADIETRCREMDIHPTGVLWGDGTSEQGVPDEYRHWLTALSNARVKPMQRSLRLPVREFGWQLEDDALLLQFTLGRGAFATSVLREIASVVNAEGR